MEVHEKNLDCVSIKDQSGHELGKLYFVPCDMGIPARVRELTELFPSLVSHAMPLNIHLDGTAEGIDAAKLQEAEQQLYDTLDYVCGVATAQEVFRQYRPFARVDGDFWATKVVRALSEIMPRLSVRMDHIARTTWPGLLGKGKKRK